MLVAEFVTGAGVGTVGRVLSWLLWLGDGLWASCSGGYLHGLVEGLWAGCSVGYSVWWRGYGPGAQLVTWSGGWAAGRLLSSFFELVDGL